MRPRLSIEVAPELDLDELSLRRPQPMIEGTRVSENDHTSLQFSRGISNALIRALFHRTSEPCLMFIPHGICNYMLFLPEVRHLHLDDYGAHPSTSQHGNSNSQDDANSAGTTEPAPAAAPKREPKYDSEIRPPLHHIV